MKTTATELLLLDAATAIGSTNVQLDGPALQRGAKAVFLAALALIKDESGWCKGVRMRVQVESFVRPEMRPLLPPDAISNIKEVELCYETYAVTHKQFCSAGAIGEASGDDVDTYHSSGASKVYYALTSTAKMRGYPSLETFNDAPATTHRVMLGLWYETGHRNGWL